MFTPASHRPIQGADRSIGDSRDAGPPRAGDTDAPTPVRGLVGASPATERDDADVAPMPPAPASLGLLRRVVDPMALTFDAIRVSSGSLLPGLTRMRSRGRAPGPTTGVEREQGTVIRRYRSYPYREPAWVNHPQRAHFVSQLALADTFTNPLIVRLPHPDANVNVIPDLRATLRGYFTPHGHNNTFGQQLMLGPGIYDVNLRDANATLATFRIAVLNPGQTIPQAQAADAARVNNVGAFLDPPYAVERVCTPSFIANHVSNSLIGGMNSQLISAYRERNNTVIALDGPGLANLAAEVRQHNVTDAYNLGAHYITNNEYDVIDKFNRQIIRYRTRFQYDVYYHPVDGVWKVNHFQGIQGPSATTVLENLAQAPLEFLAPRRNAHATEANVTVRVRTQPGALNVALAIDGAAPVPMNAVAAADTYEFQWSGIAPGEHRLLASATVNGAARDLLRVYTRT